MTHTVIIITDIEARIAELRQIREKATGRTMKAFYASAISELILVQSFGKEVSLTDEDIEAKAIEAVKKTTEYGSSEAPIGSSARSYFETEVKGYKQALKDIK
jgi:hypothetical protein